MFTDTKAFSGFSVDDVPRATQFYREVLGLQVTDGDMDDAMIDVSGGGQILVYPKENHEPASFTVLNFPVDDIEAAVDELTRRGVTFERYEGTDIETDPKGIFRGGGPLIAWFKDPAGNVMSVLQSG